MENTAKSHEAVPHLQKIQQKKPVAKKTILAITSIIVILGIGVTFYFTNRIEKFFWEARTSSVAEVTHELVIHYLKKGDVENWHNAESNAHLAEFAKEAKEFIPSTVAMKIYSTDGILAWTDLKRVQPGYQKSESDGQLAQVRANKSIIMPAGEATKNELGKTSLLEVWSTMEDNLGNTMGYFEIYFDTSDIQTFVDEIKYSIWIVIIIMLGIVLVLINLAFREQDVRIIEQSEYINGIIEQSPIGIYTINTNGFIESYNPSMMRISGITDANETIGKNVFDAVAYQKNGLDKLLMSGLGGVPFETEVEVESSLGEHKKTYRHYYGVPLRNPAGEVDHLLVMVEDITGRKELERKVTEHTEDLESNVNERTKTLQDKLNELERFQRLTVDREIRMTELKQEIEKMRVKLESSGMNPNA
ncbi:MAG: hypothetical protein UW27_C0004G0012 [Parcubacteria group bacterium GW2011_GWA1_44_13]|uniref:PAC domain-containing protein n=1 Tax=Candidatus Nomurabacteria bacterium GW2011_GWB1_44_12 TaxID=1618748 RepID=A0A837ICH8_9BACT|nr:MAG: hypothetical protein UW17_C0029G0004 [Candidatus Nomurabacteria bacterium GW2011_GWD1_44_10]KKT36531.1 MAG: hypothetical protein UW25_C0005G0013 [Candidatus Nomurabacteria bacterium GW2011_GWB1_44_12]KKT38157.1 MAG: hypothetical protein UW27_C0004G0012 [Parcubacteria group bacterium GW2011_GWA1_44_13]KKT60233.1 MAG: hypothetical protein UW54_C0015G0007 [Parcubacteria group bacterium GW2011_GWC1_44_26]HBB44095.1 hypothetical protein [Candidatus Yonathbacteria bacterium]